jgi:Zn-dependent protease with chaperone function
MNNQSHRNHHFWDLILVASLMASLGLAVVGYGFATQWTQTLWHVCQDGLQNLAGHAPVSWQLVILALLLLVLWRGLWSFGRQMWQTHRFARGFLPLQIEPPAPLRCLLRAHALTTANLVCLDLTAVHAFCLGFWQPRIWLTTGLLNTLTDDELNAVLAHEAHHLHQRDPLRLAIGRAVGNAFFFLPLMASLAGQAELDQELEADKAAIAHLGDDLPLLCALQKLLARQSAPQSALPATITAFNITEARLRRLVYPTPQPKRNWRDTWSQWLMNLGVLVMLTFFGYLSVQPVMAHTPLDACTVEEVMQPLQTQLPLNERPFSDRLR